MVDIHSDEYIIGQNIRKYRKQKGWRRRDGGSPADNKERGSGGRTDGCGFCGKRTYHHA